MPENKTVMRIISLVIAVLMWIYVMGEVNPETKQRISNIEINFVNTEELADRGLSVVYDDDIELTATVEGRRSDVNEAKNSGLVANVDVSSCSEGTNREEVVLNLPDGISLVRISSDTVSFKVEESIEEEIPVKVTFISDGEADRDGQEPWAYDMEPETVTVTGAQSSVDKVDAVQGTVTENIVGSRARTVDMDLVPVDKDGMEIKGLTLSTDMASAKVRLMETKDVSVRITPENVEDGYEVIGYSGADSVKIIGVPRVVEKLDEIKAYADLASVTSKETVQLRLELPDGVYLYDEDRGRKVTVNVRVAD